MMALGDSASDNDDDITMISSIKGGLRNILSLLCDLYHGIWITFGLDCDDDITTVKRNDDKIIITD